MRTLTNCFILMFLATFLTSCANRHVNLTPYRKAVELIDGKHSKIMLEAKDLDFSFVDGWIPKNFFNYAAISPDGKFIAFIGENSWSQVVGFVEVTTQKVTLIEGCSCLENWLSVEWGPGNRFFIVNGYDTNAGAATATLYDRVRGWREIDFSDRLNDKWSLVNAIDIDRLKWLKEDILMVEYRHVGKEGEQVFVWDANSQK